MPQGIMGSGISMSAMAVETMLLSEKNYFEANFDLNAFWGFTAYHVYILVCLIAFFFSEKIKVKVR